jgi:redox-sensitive bicupin YhaK (pirin superfamily)
MDHKDYLIELGHETGNSMTTIRKIRQIFLGRPTLEGAGVRLKRALGYDQVPLFDPFLMLDDFHSENPDDYIRGFPWHPHRGIETITYMFHGEIKHQDSMKNGGTIHGGDIQWMTAGSGIIHSEMPQQTEKLLWGIQIWANLPAKNKMMDPRYRDIKKDQIKPVEIQKGISAKVICGQLDGVKGPVQDIITNPQYFDLTLAPNIKYNLSVPRGINAFAYTLEGHAFFHPDSKESIGPEHAVLYEQGDEIVIETKKEPSHFLLLSGKPLNEPVEWYGPIVMNTQEELRIAFEEYENGSFIKFKGKK